MKVILQVRGMMCAHCENRVVQACKELEGLNEIHASAVENKVECDFDEAKLNVAQIKETIEAGGYDVVEEPSTFLNQYYKKKQFTFTGSKM